jgi:hypothetical protein
VEAEMAMMRMGNPSALLIQVLVQSQVKEMRGTQVVRPETEAPAAAASWRVTAARVVRALKVAQVAVGFGVGRL